MLHIPGGVKPGLKKVLSCYAIITLSEQTLFWISKETYPEL